jgi:hypothetical protein
MANHYIDNKKLYESMSIYAKACRESKEQGKQLPRIPEYVGGCIDQIAHRIATKGNFSSYTYIEEMIDDGIENCILYLHNFDERTSKNPFGYISLIITRAFIRRIDKEKKAQYVRFKTMQKSFVTMQLNGEAIASTRKEHDPEYVSSFIEEYERKMGIKKEKIAEKKRERNAESSGT